MPGSRSGRCRSSASTAPRRPTEDRPLVPSVGQTAAAAARTEQPVPDLPLETPVLIGRKRDGEELSGDDLRRLVEGYMSGAVAEEQMSALLMAGVIRGFSDAEAVALTDALVASGDTVDLSRLRGPTVDKHSTGGVGDTTTLVVAPILAAAGLQLAKLSGRGLGHTGGTLDKLESIPGFRVALTPDEMRAQVERIGLAVAAATAELVPADKRLYALRDVTGTVPSRALIAASVMSKKIAGGASHVLLDVKTGDGAFMARREDASALAELCVRIGTARGRRTAALVTDMSQPLGDGIGNAIEVAVAVEVLRGERPGRLDELCRELAAAALVLTGTAAAVDAPAFVDELLGSGRALERFRRFVVAQGGDPAVADRPWEVLPRAPEIVEWRPGPGTVTAVRCRELGELAASLGAGRRRKEDDVDPAVGLEVLARVGDHVSPDVPVARVHARTRADAERALARLPTLVDIGEGQVAPVPLVLERVGLSGVPDLG
ncbi:MAG: thymidine phosphorylase [Actinobacteria bacterium]|nr:thymidine phosphorylase [Actinomycetota bacterium]